MSNQFRKVGPALSRLGAPVSPAGGGVAEKPKIRQIAQYSSAGAAISIGAGVLQPGDMLLLALGAINFSTASGLALPSGYTEIASAVAGSSDPVARLAFKIADGSETSAAGLYSSATKSLVVLRDHDGVCGTPQSVAITGSLTSNTFTSVEGDDDFSIAVLANSRPLTSVTGYEEGDTDAYLRGILGGTYQGYGVIKPRGAGDILRIPVVQNASGGFFSVVARIKSK